MITKKNGVLKLIGDTLIVLLDKIELKKHRIAAEGLCGELNGMNITLVGAQNQIIFLCVKILSAVAMRSFS